MLSPGKYHLHIPKDPEGNLKFRRWVVKTCLTDKSFRRGIMDACRKDILFWIDTFVWQYNPRKLDHEVEPFISWDFQDPAIAWVLDHLERQRDGIIEKSRELGASWLILIVFDWLCLFHNWKTFTAISHTEEAVDKKDRKASLFWKVKFIHDFLPAWMGRVRKIKNSFHYEDTKSSFDGVATTSRSNVGGRDTGLLLDEFGKQQAAPEIWSNTADTGPRIVVSTHYGIGTKFFDLCQSESIDKFVMHWSQHPDKKKGLYRYNPSNNQVEILDKTYPFPPDYKFVMTGDPTGGPYPGLRSPWYDEECIRRESKRDVAMHLDIDAKGSTSQFFDRLTILVLKQTYCHEPYWEGDILFSDAGKSRGLEKRNGGPLRLWCHLPNGKPIPATNVFGCDVATGTGATPSCLLGINAITGEQFLEYANPFIQPEVFALLAVSLSWLFKNEFGEGAMLGWEQGGPGLVFGNKVIELGYTNVYMMKDDFDISSTETDKPGWYASPRNMRLLLEQFRSAISSRQCLIRSERTLEECLSFEYDKRGQVVHGNFKGILDPSGATVNHADRVIGAAIAWKLAKGTWKETRKKEIAQPTLLSLEWRRQRADREKREMEASSYG